MTNAPSFNELPNLTRDRLQKVVDAVIEVNPPITPLNRGWVGVFMCGLR